MTTGAPSAAFEPPRTPGATAPGATAPDAAPRRRP
ncbi:MotA/TolQ/ExbB proton channel family protein, partial [Streptomyces triticirhizae]